MLKEKTAIIDWHFPCHYTIYIYYWSRTKPIFKIRSISTTEIFAQYVHSTGSMSRISASLFDVAMVAGTSRVSRLSACLISTRISCTQVIFLIIPKGCPTMLTLVSGLSFCFRNSIYFEYVRVSNMLYVN